MAGRQQIDPDSGSPKPGGENNGMTAIAWNDSLKLDQPHVDADHVEFVRLINELADAAEGDGALGAFDALHAHVEAHFAREEGWMAATGFSADNCHTKQHRMVLDLMREVRECAVDRSEWEPLRLLPAALAEWLPQHADMMDAALVFTMKQLGFDPDNPQPVAPPASSEAAHAGCGSSSCT